MVVTCRDSQLLLSVFISHGCPMEYSRITMNCMAEPEPWSPSTPANREAMAWGASWAGSAPCGKWEPSKHVTKPLLKQLKPTRLHNITQHYTTKSEDWKSQSPLEFHKDHQGSFLIELANTMQYLNTVHSQSLNSLALLFLNLPQRTCKACIPTRDNKSVWWKLMELDTTTCHSFSKHRGLNTATCRGTEVGKHILDRLTS